MSMTAQFVAITPSELAELARQPDGVPDRFLARLDTPDPERTLDIEQAWNGIHFLLTGESLDGDPPHADVILGGEELGPDLVYGPVRVLAPADVRVVAALLVALPSQRLRDRYRPDELEAHEIYPSGIWHDDEEATFRWLALHYEALRAFYRQAAARGDAVLLAII